MFFTAQSTRRIANTVTEWERFNKTGQIPRRGRRGAPWSAIREGVVRESGGIAANSYGDVELCLNADDAGANETFRCYNDWIYGSDGIPEKVSEGKRVYFAWIPESNKWKIIGADCEVPPAPAPPGHANSINLTTAAGGTGPGSYDLTFAINRVTTLDASNDSVDLPNDFAQDSFCVVRNAVGSGGILKVYPDTGGEINELAVDVAVELAPGESFTCWVSEVSANRHWIIS